MPALAVTTFLGGLLPTYGPVIAQVGIILTLVFALALGRDGGPANAALTALGFLLGGMAFLVLALAPVALRRLPHPSGTAPRAARAHGAPVAAPGGSSIPHAPVIRFAALRAAGTALVAGTAWGSGIAYPHWAAFVVILSVRPDQMAALRLTTQRVVGTVLGAGLADGVLHLVHDPLVVAGLAIGGEFLAVTVKDVNFAVFVFFLTAQTLLLVSLPTPGQAPAALRVATTMLGAMVALGISVLGAWLANRAAAPPGRSTRTTPGSAEG